SVALTAMTAMTLALPSRSTATPMATCPAAAQRIWTSQLARCSPALRRGHGEIDDLLARKPVDQAGEVLLAHGLVTELQAEHPASRRTDDRGLIFVEQRRDVGDTGVLRKTHQRARRRGAADITGHWLVHAERGRPEIAGLVHQHSADHGSLREEQDRPERR